MDNLKSLNNGTDIRGIALNHENLKVNLTEEAVIHIGKGFYHWLSKDNDNISIAIGCDSRLSGDSLKKSCIKSLMACGVKVLDCGLATTPAMFMTTVMEKYKCTGAIMITASHLPYYYNGMKFFTEKGGCEKENILEIIDLGYEEIKAQKKGSLEKANLIEDYSGILVNTIREKTKKDKALEGLKIIVDAGNGSGGFFAEKVLKPLGADIEGSQFLNPDGRFPNHIPNPENNEAMESISKAVIKNNADLGIIFDTDVDRAAIVGKGGIQINKNSLIAIIAAIILEENSNSTIVTDSITSDGLKEFIENLGGKHHRFKRGYKNVINESIRLNKEGEKSYIAIETSGHAALKENYFLDDGAYLVAKILIKIAKLNEEGKEIISLIENLKEPLDSKSFRLPIREENFKEYGSLILEDIRKYAKEKEEWTIVEPNYEGVKVSVDEGWFLIRMSLHEPLIAINMESNKENGVNKIREELVRFLKGYDLLEMESLEKIEIYN